MPRNTTGLRRGNGGSRKGVPNKKTLAFREFWRAKLESEDYRANLWRRIHAGRASHMETYLARLLIGEPTQQVEHSGGVTIRHELPE